MTVNWQRYCVDHKKMQQHECSCSQAHQFQDRLRTQDPDVLDSLRLSGDLCDVTLVVADQEFKAHKVILAASSPYFKAMFATAFDEKDHSKIIIQNTLPKYFEMILDFIYTGRRMEITVENVQSLLETASMLNIELAMDMCSQFLAERLDTSNCLDILNLAINTGCHNLKREAEMFAGKNFNKIVDSVEFPILSLENVMSLISLDTLDVLEETIVAQAVMPWINHEPDSRSSSLAKLLPHVRLPHLSPDFIEDTVKPFLRVNNCRDFLDRIHVYQALDTVEKCSTDRYNQQPRECQNKVILGLGQFRADALAEDNTFHIFQFDQKVEKWTFPEKLRYPLNLEDFKTWKLRNIIVDMDKVFIFFDEDEDEHCVIILEPKSGRWKEHYLPYNRGQEGVAVLDGIIYIVGGWSTSSLVDKLKILSIDPYNNSRKALASMSCGRESPGVIAFDGKIFVFGGSSTDPDQDPLVSSCEVYHVKENRWETIADMPTPRECVAVTELHGKIYVIGGESEGIELKVVECYDPEKNTWESLPDMKVGKYSTPISPAVGFNGKVFVGGRRARYYEDEEDWKFDYIESFDIRKKQWSLIEVGDDDHPCIISMFVMPRKFLSPDL